MNLFGRNLVTIVLPALLSVQVALAETIDRIVVIVNEEIITQSDVQKYAQQMRTGGFSDDLLDVDRTPREELLKDQKKILERMIDAKLIDTEVKKQSMNVTIERVEQEVRNISKQNNISREDLKKALAERGINFSQYQDYIKTGLERQSLIQKEITPKIRISEDDVLSAFAAQRRGQVDQAFEYTLSHILFRSEKGGKDAAQARAEQALKRLKEGMSFEKLSSEASEDPNYEQGGAFGVFKSGEMAKSLDQVVQKLNTGEFSSVMPIGADFHIVKVTRKKIIPDPRTESDREKIRAELYDKAYRKLLKSWLEQLRQDANIRINPS